MKSYDHKTTEKKWQEKWEQEKLYKTEDVVEGKENEYILVEFPYPSGNLHVGHWYAFAVTDIYARLRRLQGKNVLFPIGFDAFGLPAENAAIKHGLNPRDWTLSNIEKMRGQVRQMGTSFDWTREIITCTPEYYRWTQSLFLELLKAGLVEKKTTVVNWDPVDKTVLANEQVLPDGTADRSGALVEQKEMDQWTVKITKYADRLIDDLDELDWPESIKESQRNWIGKSEGAKISFTIHDSNEKIEVFTTRPDTLCGVTYLVLAPEHAIVDRLLDRVSNKDDVRAYVEKTKRKTERDRLIGEKKKTGAQLDGITAIHPVTKEALPVYIADYVLKGYGTGAIMAVPAHDERDYEFAQTFGLPSKDVVIRRFIDHSNPHVERKDIVFRKGILGIVKNPKTGKVLLLNWKEQPWTTFVVGGIEDDETPEAAARREILEETGYKNIRFIKKVLGPVQSEFFAAHKNINRVAHTWVLLFELENEEQEEISEEETKKHSLEWVDFSEITEEKMQHAEIATILSCLKQDKEEIFTGEGIVINSGEFDGLTSEEAKKKITQAVGGEMISTYKLRDWIVSRQRYWGCPIPIINCAACGAVPVPKEQLPVVLPDVDDYLPNDNGQSPLAKVDEWVNVPCPTCGAPAKRETDTLDTFVDSSWYFLRYADPKNEHTFAALEKLQQWMPVDFYSGGAEHTTMHLLYSRFFHKALFDVGLVDTKEPFKVRLNRGLILGTDGNKMSKSKGNVIDPDKEVEIFGADTIRTYLAFIGPYNEPGNYPWDQNGIVGIRRFVERCMMLPTYIVEESSKDMTQLLHQTIKKVTEDTGRLKFNTAIAQMMICMTMIQKKGISNEDARQFTTLLAPFIPHVSEEIWEQLGVDVSVHKQSWPVYNPELIVGDAITIAIQVNGKVRDMVEISPNSTQQEIENIVLQREQVTKWLDGKTPKKIVYVPQKIISIVV